MKKLSFNRIIGMCLLVLFILPVSPAYSQVRYDSTHRLDMQLLRKGRTQIVIGALAIPVGAALYGVGRLVYNIGDTPNQATIAMVAGGAVFAFGIVTLIRGVDNASNARVRLTVDRQQSSVEGSSGMVKAGIYIPL